MSSPSRPPFYRNLKFLILLIVLLLVVSTTFYVLILRNRDLPAGLAANRVLVYILWYANITFLLILVFIIVRQFVKLILERRRKQLGFRLRTKLILSLMALVLLPVVYLFIIASDLILHAGDVPADLPVVFSGMRGLVQDWDRGRIRVLREEAQGLRKVLEETPPAAWYPAAQAFLAEGDAPITEVYQERRLLFSLGRSPAYLSSSQRLPHDFLQEIGGSGESFLWQESRGVWILRVGIRMRHGSREYQVIVGEVPDPALSRARAAFLNLDQTLSQWAVERRTLGTTRLLTFLLLTLSVVFAGVWMGTYLSRHFTHPVRLLLEGTRKIGEGDLDVHLPPPAMDEWGVLFGGFNAMAAQLKAYREELAREREYLSSLIAHLTHGLVSFEPDGGILTSNPAARRILRLPGEETDLYRGLDRSCPALKAWLEEAVASGRDVKAEALDITLHEGMQVSVSLVRLPGERRLLIAEDVTGLIRIQKQATWKEAAQRIAHEIKNPLTPIRLHAERLMKKAGEGTLGQSDMATSLEAILEEVANMKTMLDAFSQFARMPVPNPQPFELQELFAQLEEMHRGMHPGMRFAFSIPAGLPPVRADRELLRRALVNLMDNAVEACRLQGAVHMEARASDGTLEIRVSDDGPGIPDAQKERIFQPYVSTKGRGSGMGLSIVERIIRDHGGTVRATDNTPKGTVFTITLPL
jgi:two-component system nitrogen regulation sensor histidine kinase NtrY